MPNFILSLLYNNTYVDLITQASESIEPGIYGSIPSSIIPVNPALFGNYRAGFYQDTLNLYPLTTPLYSIYQLLYKVPLQAAASNALSTIPTHSDSTNTSVFDISATGRILKSRSISDPLKTLETFLQNDRDTLLKVGHLAATVSYETGLPVFPTKANDFSKLSFEVSKNEYFKSVHEFENQIIADNFNTTNFPSTTSRSIKNSDIKSIKSLTFDPNGKMTFVTGTETTPHTTTTGEYVGIFNSSLSFNKLVKEVASHLSEIHKASAYLSSKKLAIILSCCFLSILILNFTQLTLLCL